MTPEDRNELPEAPQPPSKVQVGRRRLLRGGLATAPALLTLVNRPVMAADCRTASAYGSANLSRAGSAPFQCGGKKPATWSGLVDTNWPPTAPPGTKFSAVFGASPAYGDKTLLEMVSLSDTGARLAKHLAAAYLNAVANPPLTPAEVLSVWTVKEIWTKVAGTPGYYEPTGGIRWNSDQVIAWIQTTMPK